VSSGFPLGKVGIFPLGRIREITGTTNVNAMWECELLKSRESQRIWNFFSSTGNKYLFVVSGSCIILAGKIKLGFGKKFG
jgi:hypothetical protein